METFAPAFVYRHTKVRIVTERHIEFIDLTESLEGLLAESRVETGFLNVQSLHTTAAIVVNEGEPLLLEDFERTLRKLAPDDAPYRHDDETVRTVNLNPGERPNGESHCRALMLGSSACLNVLNGRLQLGRWQRVFLVELDGPRSRDVSVLLMGEAAQ
jgi:secondary thiamine-phosphate synthase enzyme